MSNYTPVFSALALPFVAVALMTACEESRNYAASGASATSDDASVQNTVEGDGSAGFGANDGGATSQGAPQDSNHTGQLNVSLDRDAAYGDAAVGSDGAVLDAAVALDGATLEGDAEPPPPPARCEDNDACDDGNECNGAETCDDGKCRAGDVEDDGTICTGASELDFVCRDGNCLKSRCGDGLVDARLNEVCDDGNVTNGDGCNVDCTYSCADNEFCNDGNVCNGDETCDLEAHVCVAGTKADDATECGTDRACMNGRCLSTGCGDDQITDEEECDDGNLVEGDGCNAYCQFDCEQDTDCDDQNVCTGQEICNLETHQCELGEPLLCDDEVSCTEDDCDPVGGCKFSLIDADKDGQSPIVEGSTCGTDCDDDNDQVFVGAGELCDEIDNNCDGNEDEFATIWYPDCDGDGYALMNSESVQQCEEPGAPSSCPPGSRGTWTIRAPSDSVNADCWDEDPAIYPRTDSVWSTTAIDGRTDYAFDYNCSYSDEPQYTKVNVPTNSTCSPLSIQPAVELPVEIAVDLLQAPDGLNSLVVDDGTRGNLQILCTGKSGWEAAAAPACGQPGTYSFCKGCTREIDTAYVQPCQ